MSAPTTRRTACNRDCPDACGLVATVRDGRVTALRGDPAHPFTRGTICPRTARFLDRQHSPDRLLNPLFRERVSDPFRRIGWDEALDVAASRLTRIRDESGPAAILHYRCGGSLGLLTGLADLFFDRFGPVATKRGDVCSGAGEWAQEEDFGVCDGPDPADMLAAARHVVLWGRNPITSSVHLVPFIREARARGAHVTLIDPVRHKSVALADRFVQPRPGGDLALALGVARALFDRGAAHPDAAAWCGGLDAFRALVRSRPPDAWLAEADVPPDDLDHLAGLFAAGAAPVAVLLGWGLGRRVRGAATVRAIDALALVSGNAGVPGAGVQFCVRRRSAFDLPAPSAPPPRTVSETALGRGILAASDPPLRAVWVTAGNPVAMLPDSETTAAALRSREFVAVADAFLTDTAACAHLVLPVPTLLEADDLVGSYGHSWLTASRPVVPPPPEVRSDLEIAQGLAARTGLDDVLAGTAREWKERICTRLRAAGVTVDDLEAGAVRNPFRPRVPFADAAAPGGRRFATPDGRARLLASVPPADPAEVPGFPLTLSALSVPEAQSSQWARDPGPGPAEVRVHPDVAAAACPGGIPDGGAARLESAVGSMAVRVRHDPGQRRDVALMAKGGHLSAGRCANALVAPRETDAGDGTALYDERVRLVP
ncbi:MAG: molybdopterin-dependent oxidoreductase [Deltaproteobacteria bacterium]|nr:molybdopterin-dependent oxidoreductase [Deltaproteobacteria bacterium]